jgi:hypothetical protein
MRPELDLKEIERRAWRSFFDDGIWDIYIGGLMLLMSGLAALSDLGLPALHRMTLYIVLIAVLVITMKLAKRRITVPRLGWVKFGKGRERKRTGARFVLGISVLLTAALLFLTFRRRIEGSSVISTRIPFMVLLVGIQAFIILALVAWFLEFPRMIFHGFLIGASITLSILLRSPLALAIAGAIILIVGLVYLIRFLKKYPRSVEEINANA